MKVSNCKLNDILVIEPDVHSDQRGFFMEIWNLRKLAESGINANFVQENHSRSKQGTLRGLHYQIRHPQGKLLRAIRGEVYDVAVDLRQSSSTFGKWHGIVLSESNKKILWVPEGFAHGFMALSDFAELQYSCTDYYSPEYERCIKYDDADLAIAWPFPKGIELIISAKDIDGKAFKNADIFE